MPNQASPGRRCISDYSPVVGGHCAGCGAILPRVHGFSDLDEAHVQGLIVSGNTVAAIRHIHDEFALPIVDAKRIVEHMYGNPRQVLGPPCAHCGTPLRTPRAKYCTECGSKRTALE